MHLPAEIIEEQARTLYLTTPHSGAGTTTCTSALAKSLCTSLNKKLIIIDGNNHSSSSLTQQMELQSKPGWTDYLCSDKQDLAAMACPVDNELFHIMPSGNTERGSKALDNFKKTETGIKDLHQSFDIILYDAPAVFSQNSQPLLASLFSGVILVVNSQTTHLEVTESAVDRLVQFNAKILGTILNRRRYHVPQWLYKIL